MESLDTPNLTRTHEVKESPKIGIILCTVYEVKEREWKEEGQWDQRGLQGGVM